MRNFSNFIPAMVVLLISSCTGGRQFTEQKNMAVDAYQTGDYNKALESAEQIIMKTGEKGKSAAGQIFAIAGKSAYQLGTYDQSRDYLISAREEGYLDEQTIVFQADNYHRIDNLSKEITLLEEYIEKYPGGKYINTIRTRLFQTCMESDNFELAQELWPLLDLQSKSETGNLEVYLAINQALNNDQVCDSIASMILDTHPEHESSLNWYAEKYYWKAENSYQAEMKAYKGNKTRKQYAKLLKAFKIVTIDFKQSLDYYTKLHNLYPKPEYAKYLGNIYARLSDEKNAKYYHDKAL
jgi:tetratricopeptide (TPR) repeat protein